MYKQLYPEDKEVDLIKFEQVELDPATQAEVDEWLYHQRLQEKYEQFFREEAVAKNASRAAAKGKELDDGLVRRILLYLNENYEKDYMISRDYEEDSKFEEELGA